MGGWVGFVEYKILYRVKTSIARNGWMGGLQKMITVLGIFDTYKGSV
jgi:hypothetical protein